MSLRISDINLHDFRSYSELSLTGVGDLTIFSGENAVGKTNIIEAIGLLTSLTSFRHATSKEIIKQNSDFSRISIGLEDEKRKLDVSLTVTEEKKQYTLNGKAKRVSELKGLLPSVSFTPEDMDLIKGSDSIRRRELDVLGSQLNTNYYQIIKDYDKLLRHKNHLLKENESPALIESIDELMIKVGSQLTSYRSAFFLKLLGISSNLYTKITGSDEKLDGIYRSSWQSKIHDMPIDIVRQHMEAAMEEMREREINQGHTLIGPHRDKIEVTLNGLPASKFASQGQQRSVVLAWKLAEVELIEEMLGQLPVLLLDDVMSELDSTRRGALVNFLSNEIQTFITTANIDYFDQKMLDRAQVINLPII